MRSPLVLLAVFFLLGHSLRAGESTSAPAATNPDLDREQDGLTNQEEMRRGTSPNASDSDNDSIPDPDDAVGNDPVMRVPAALETTYAIIDLGSEYQPAGVNDRAEVLLLKPGAAPETESAAIWKNGTLIPIAEGRKDSFRGPFLNGDVCFGTPDTTSAVPGGNQTISENKRWASATQTISAAGRYYEHHALTTAPGIPYPGTAPQMSVMTTNVRGTAERLLSAMKAHIDPQLVDYYVVPGGTHHQDYGAEMHWTNDQGFNTFSAWTNTGQEITKTIDGIVLPPISLHARMVLGGYVGPYDGQSNSFGAIAWQGVAIPSQPPGDLRLNMSQFMVATMDGTPTVISPINGSRQPIPGAESLADLNNKTTPEGDPTSWEAAAARPRSGATTPGSSARAASPATFTSPPPPPALPTEPSATASSSHSATRSGATAPRARSPNSAARAPTNTRPGTSSKSAPMPTTSSPKPSQPPEVPPTHSCSCPRISRSTPTATE